MLKLLASAPLLIVLSCGSHCALAQAVLVRVDQARVATNTRGDATFDANVMGVIKPFVTTQSARDFYAYDAPTRDSFNGPVTLTPERIHYFFVQASDGLASFVVLDKPGNADGGRVQMHRAVWPRGAVVEDIGGIDLESFCGSNGTVSGNNSRDWRNRVQNWGAASTDGFIYRLNPNTLTAMRYKLNAASGNCNDADLYRGITSMAALSSDNSATLLRLGQETVRFSVIPACELTGWPSTQATCAGSTVTFKARPNTTGTAAFTWRKGTTPIALPSPRLSVSTSVDGLESTLTVTGVTTSDGGNYNCVVTSACGTQTTVNLALFVSSGQPTTSAPTSISTTCGIPAVFSVTAGGSGPFRYQWKFNGVAMHDVGSRITGTDAATLTIPNAEFPQTGSYSCLVSNACGSIESPAAMLTVLGVCCDSIDFNQNDVFPEDQDIIDFFFVLAGGLCSEEECADIDFNNNTVFPEDQDVIDFFNVLAGGTCPA